MSRFNGHESPNADPPSAWDPDVGKRIKMDDDYKGIKAKVFSLDTTIGTTENWAQDEDPSQPDAAIAQIQLASWYVGEMNQHKYKIWVGSSLARLSAPDKSLMGNIGHNQPEVPHRQNV